MDMAQRTVILNGAAGQFAFAIPPNSTFANNSEVIDVTQLSQEAIDGIYGRPNILPQNTVAISYSSYEMNELEELAPESGPFISGINFDSSVLEYLTQERNLFSEHIPNWTPPPPPAGPLPAMTREQYQDYLDDNWKLGGIMNNQWRQSSYVLFNSPQHIIDFEAIAQIIMNPDWDGADFTNTQSTFNWIFENFGPGQIMQQITILSSNDVMRWYLFVGNLYNMLSRAYGTGKKSWGWPPSEPRPGFFKRVWSGIKKAFPGLIIVRGAVITVLSMNVREWATKMDNAVDNGGRAKLQKTWEGLGGDWPNLRAAIRTGKNKNAFLGTPGLGDPATITAIATAAAAIGGLLAAIKEFLPEDWQDEFENAANAAAAVNCIQYKNAYLEFFGSLLDDGAPEDWSAMFDDFEVQFPEIPENCRRYFQDAGNTVGDRFKDQILDQFLPPGWDNPAGTDDDDDEETSGPTTPPPPPRGVAPGNESGNNSGILVIGGIIAMLAASK